LKTLLSFQSMTSENLCEPSPILAPLGEILCEPRRLWRHGSHAPGHLMAKIMPLFVRIWPIYDVIREQHYRSTVHCE